MIGIIVLAAGKGERFGGNKMLAKVENKTFLEHTLDKVIQLGNNPVICVTSTKVWEQLGDYSELIWAQNDRPEYGISYSIKRGIETFCQQSETQVEGYLFLVGDQPLLTRESIQGLVGAFENNPKKIHCMACEEVAGNPVIFPRWLEAELLSLQGDRGGKVLLKKYPQEVLNYQVSKEELWDLDTQEAYKQFKRRKENGTVKRED